MATTDPFARFVNTAREAKHLASLRFNIDPVPASRPRVTRWGVYYAKTYKTWRDLAKTAIEKGSLELDPRQPLLILIESIARKAKTSKLLYPSPDVDNYAKGPMDTITDVGGYWHDDKQVVHLISSKRFASPDEEPGTKVHLYALP